MKLNVITLVIYALVVFPACKSRTESRSNLAELPQLPKGKNAKNLRKDTLETFDSLKTVIEQDALSNKLPLVVIDHEDLSRRYPSKKEILDHSTLKKTHKIYVGSLHSKYVIGISVPHLGKTSQQGKPLTALFVKYNTEEVSKKGGLYQFKRKDGEPVSFTSGSDHQIFRKKISGQLQRMRSLGADAFNEEEKFSFMKEMNENKTKIAGLEEEKFDAIDLLGGALTALIFGAIVYIIVLAGSELSQTQAFLRVAIAVVIITAIVIVGALISNKTKNKRIRELEQRNDNLLKMHFFNGGAQAF